MKIFYLYQLIFVLTLPLAVAQDKPNILWLTTEDMTFDYLSVYGATAIETPNLDAFAASGVLFNNAYSNGPQCSPARTTIITGAYSPALSAEFHRRDVTYPTNFLWPSKLRDAGYWTSNKGKTDYNIKNEPELEDIIWSKRSGTFENAPANQPFFSVQNFYTTHMSRITNARDFNLRVNRTVSPNDVTPPPYLPNTADMDTLRDDLAWYYDAVKELDQWFGSRLEALEATGRADNTIIFFYSDHGGSMPGSKGYLRQEGVKVPMMIYFPEKWKHLEPDHTNGVNNDIVQFVDLAPTVLALAGLEKMDHMQGRAFCGTDEQKEEAPEYSYLYKANQESNFIPSRGITDGQWKLIWNYNTFWNSGSRQGFQWLMPGYREWENAYRSGNTTGWTDMQKYHWESMVPFELYDLSNDPEEVNNLADEAAYSTKLEDMKSILQQMIRDNVDIGWNPPSLRDTATTTTYYEIVRSGAVDMELIYQAAELASVAEASDTTALLELLVDSNPTVRYWAATGFSQLAFNNKIETLPQLVKDKIHHSWDSDDARLMCASAMVALENYCGSVDLILNTNLVYSMNLGDRSGPLAQGLYDIFQSGNNFTLRSALINAGVISYEYLVDATAVAGSLDQIPINEEALEQSAVLEDCEASLACGTLFLDQFSDDAFPPEWSKLQNADLIEVVNGRMKVALGNPETSVQRTFETQVLGRPTYGFTVNSEKNFFRALVLLEDAQGDTVTGFFLGNNGEKNIYVMTGTSFSGDQPLDLGDPLLESDIEKLVDYDFEITVDFEEGVASVNIEGAAFNTISNIPLIKPNATEIAAVKFVLISMFQGNGSIYIDDFFLSDLNVDYVDYNVAKGRIEDLLAGSPVGTEVGDYPVEAFDDLTQFYLSIPGVLCETSQEEIDATTASMEEIIEMFLASKIELVSVSSIIISGNTEMVIRSEQQLSVSITPADATDSSVTWSTSDDSIVEVDQTGKVTATAVGTASVTASAVDDSGVLHEFEINVFPALITELLLTGDGEMAIGESQTLQVVVLPDSATNKTYSYTSSVETVATVSESGIVNALSAGITSITALATDGSEVTSSLEITVVAVLSGTEIAEQLILYPNPSEDKVFLKGLQEDNYRFELFDLAGSSLAKGKLNSEKSVDITSLEPGIYSLVLSDDTSQVRLKVIRGFGGR